MRTYLLMLVFVSATAIFGQGKIFTSEEALKEFGEVIISVEIDVEMVTVYLQDKDTKSLLFSMYDKEASITKGGGTILLGKLKKDQIRYKYSAEILNEFFGKIKSNKVRLETRSKINPKTKTNYFSIGEVVEAGKGGLVLEMAGNCPPFCD